MGRTKSTPRDSPPIKRSKARRAGRMQCSMHKRAYTEVYNPKMNGECGFEATMWVARTTLSKASVRELRRQVSQAIYYARLEGEDIAGMTVHDMLRSEGLTLAAYSERVAGGIWAPIWEIHLAARALGGECDL